MAAMHNTAAVQRRLATTKIVKYTKSKSDGNILIPETLQRSDQDRQERLTENPSAGAQWRAPRCDSLLEHCRTGPACDIPKLPRKTNNSS